MGKVDTELNFLQTVYKVTVITSISNELRPAEWENMRIFCTKFSR